MDRHYPLVGAFALLFAASIHTVRAMTRLPVDALLPVWASVFLAVILLYCTVQYALERHRARSAWGGMHPYDATTALFAGAFLVHSYRVLFDSSILRVLPVWASVTAIPVLLGLAAYNLHVDVSRR